MAGSFEDCGPVKISESTKPTQEMNEKELKEFNDQVKLDKSAIKKGYDEVKEKIKALRQDYRVAVNNDTRSGSGRIMHDNWDDLTQIWAGSPTTKAIKNACTTREVNGESISEIREDEDQETLENAFNEIEACKEADSWPHLHPEQQDESHHDNSVSEDSDVQAGSKRVLPVKPTPKFVDNKRKKLEKQLSAKQRDMVLMDAAKKAQFFNNQHVDTQFGQERRLSASQFDCCGVRGVGDWHPYLNPCKDPNADGCLDKFEDNSREFLVVIGGLCIGLTLIEIIGMILSIALILKINKEKKFSPKPKEDYGKF